MRWLPSAVLGLVASAMSLTTMASAQEDDRARLHFESGRSYFAEGQYERALQEFEQAFTLSDRPALLYNIGTTRERLGLYAEAADAYEQYLARVPEVEDREVMQRRIANLRERARREAEASERTPDRTPGESPAPTPTTPAAAGGGDGLLIGGIAALSVAGVGLVMAGIFGGLALGEQASVQSGCFATRSCTPADVSTMDTFALVADVSWPIALAAGVAGAVLVALGATAAPAERAVLVTPFADPNGGGVLLGGTF